MRKKKTYVFNIILMIVVLAFTFYTLLHGEDLREILSVLKKADKSWLYLLLCLLLHIWFCRQYP